MTKEVFEQNSSYITCALAALHEAFDKIDEDQKGSLNQDGVRQVLQLIGQNPTKAEMKQSFTQFGNIQPVGRH